MANLEEENGWACGQEATRQAHGMASWQSDVQLSRLPPWSTQGTLALLLHNSRFYPAVQPQHCLFLPLLLLLPLHHLVVTQLPLLVLLWRSMAPQPQLHLHLRLASLLVLVLGWHWHHLPYTAAHQTESRTPTGCPWLHSLPHVTGLLTEDDVYCRGVACADGFRACVKLWASTRT